MSSCKINIDFTRFHERLSIQPFSYTCFLVRNHPWVWKTIDYLFLAFFQLKFNDEVWWRHTYICILSMNCVIRQLIMIERSMESHKIVKPNLKRKTIRKSEDTTQLKPRCVRFWFRNRWWENDIFLRTNRWIWTHLFIIIT